MKRLFSFLFMFILLTVHATASTQDGLKAAFDELNYSLTVEWDQKDMSFFNNQSEKFTTELMKLRDSGMTNKELMDFAVSQVKDKNLAKEIQTTFSMVSINAMSTEDAQEHVKSIITKSYGTGASWSGRATATTVVAIIAIAAVILIINKDKIKKEVEKCYMTYKCTESCPLVGPCQQVCGNECI